jgi:hypothetical protein
MVVILVAALVGSAIQSASDFRASGESGDSFPGRHPLVGTWLTMSAQGTSTYTFSADGSVTAGLPVAASHTAPGNVTYLSPGIGVWTSTGSLTGHATVVYWLADEGGTTGGTLTLHAHLEVSPDGLTLIDGSPDTVLTYRDATHAVTQVITPYRTGPGQAAPMTGVRMTISTPGFSADTDSSVPTPILTCEYPVCPLPD